MKLSKESGVANSVVAFETDPVGADGHSRWYVHVTGVATPCQEAANPGFRLATEIFDSAALRSICGEAFVLTNANRLMRYNAVTRANALRAGIAAAIADANPRLGLSLLRRFGRVETIAAIHASGDIERIVRDSVTGTGHVCGTCRMGRPDDRLAVCDEHARVYGVDGLRVGDASLMPTVPSGNTHIPTVMVAEKTAHSILHEENDH